MDFIVLNALKWIFILAYGYSHYTKLNLSFEFSHCLFPQNHLSFSKSTIFQVFFFCFNGIQFWLTLTHTKQSYFLSRFSSTFHKKTREFQQICQIFLKKYQVKILKNVSRGPQFMLVNVVRNDIMVFWFGCFSIPIIAILLQRNVYNFHLWFIVLVSVRQKEFQSKNQRGQQWHFAENKCSTR